MEDVECTRCNDTGYITVRVTFPMSYVCAGPSPEYAKGVTDVRCDACDPMKCFQEEADETFLDVRLGT